MGITRANYAWTGLVGIVALSVSIGCQKFDLKRPIPWKAAETEEEAPVRLVAVWTDTVLHQAGKNAQRGFGGRVLFYSKESGEPIQTEGTLVVYAFEENTSELPSAAPDRKFVFPADQFVRHYSKSKLGHSYSFWLPWDDAGGEQKEVTLIARFQPKQGGLVVGESSRQLLPGTTPDGPPPVQQASATQPNAYSTVQQAGYQQPTSSGPSPPAQTAESYERQRMKTTTISLHNRFGRAPVAEPRVMPRALPNAGRNPAPIAPSGEPSASSAQPRQRASSPRANRFAPAEPRALGRPLTRPGAAHAPWRQPPEE